MIKITSLGAIVGALFALGLSAAPAQAGSNRTWVSGHGTDSGSCPLAAPCRTFAFALSQTAAGGEIDVLDSAGYGQVGITKAISIVNDGVGVAAIEASSDNGITIAAGVGDSVHLRGLTIEGRGGLSAGILFKTGLNLTIENCVVRNFVGNGIEISPSTTSSFSVSNTIASNNGFNGIVVGPNSPAVVTGVLNKVTTNNNNRGIGVDGSGTLGGSLNVTIVDSGASNNASAGVSAHGVPVAAAPAVMLRNVVASNNKTGLEVDGSGVVLRLAHSVVTGNNTGVNTSGGGILNSYGDNDIDGNTNNNLGALTMIPTH